MILVTGGAGFIGSNLVAALCERGLPVVVCDRLREGDKWRNIAKSHPLDIVAPQHLSDWLAKHERLDAVFHMGAISSTIEQDADLVFDVNVRFSTQIWEWCSAHETRLIYASSAATYGDGKAGFDDDDDGTSLARLRPLNAYGWSKHYFDRRVVRRIEAGERPPPQWVGLKFFNVYGPNEYHKGTMQSVVAQKYPLVECGRPITLFKSYDADYADGEQLRDFVFVEDCVHVMLWLLDNPDVNGIYNLGSGAARSFADVARAMAKAADQPFGIEYVPMPEAIRPNYQYFTQARMNRLRQAGYTRPFTRLEDGIERYVTRYLAQPDRYR